MLHTRHVPILATLDNLDRIFASIRHEVRLLKSNKGSAQKLEDYLNRTIPSTEFEHHLISLMNVLATTTPHLKDDFISFLFGSRKASLILLLDAQTITVALGLVGVVEITTDSEGKFRVRDTSAAKPAASTRMDASATPRAEATPRKILARKQPVADAPVVASAAEKEFMAEVALKTPKKDAQKDSEQDSQNQSEGFQEVRKKRGGSKRNAGNISSNARVASNARRVLDFDLCQDLVKDLTTTIDPAAAEATTVVDAPYLAALVSTPKKTDV